MSRLKDSKNVYDNIPIPDRLEETVASAIEQAAARRKEDHGVPDQPVTEKRNRKRQMRQRLRKLSRRRSLGKKES